MKKRVDPPKHLKAGARNLWRRLLTDFVIDDSAGLVIVRSVCEAYQRQQEAREIVARDGVIITDRYGVPKAHPACAIERDARSQMLAGLRALKLSPEDI
jgi:P27 family predicted phage terminase small subunit